MGKGGEERKEGRKKQVRNLGRKWEVGGMGMFWGRGRGERERGGFGRGEKEGSVRTLVESV